jgi:TolA-binding protein
MLGVRARAYVGLARTAKAVGNLDDAARYYMSVAILYEDNEMVPESLYEAAAIFRKKGDFTASDNAVRELKERYPNSEWTKKAVKEAAEADRPPEPKPPAEEEFGTPGRD